MIREKTSDQHKQITAAFARTLSRPPTVDELADVEKLWEDQKATGADPLVHLCLSLFNCNEFVTVD